MPSINTAVQTLILPAKRSIGAGIFEIVRRNILTSRIPGNEEQTIMNQYKSSAELKASAKEHLFGKYGVVIRATLFVLLAITALQMLVFAACDVDTISGYIISQLLTFAVSVLNGLFISGSCFLYLKIVCDKPVMVSDIFYGFIMCPKKALKMQAYITLLQYVFMLPFLAVNYKMPGIMPDMNNPETQGGSVLLYALAFLLARAASVFISILYSQSFFLLHDFPQYKASEILPSARRLMNGHKGRLFYIYVSFIPLYLLSLLSCGIALLWVYPYMKATLAEFFLDVIRKTE